jgi:hypothetical protein
MSKACLIEWKEIYTIISLFCKASGLTVNQSKTTIHYEGLTEGELEAFKSFLPYNFSDLKFGFKYLGYHLKTGVQKACDWDWLVTKIAKKISLWCYKWLSIGGRYILVKSVLEGQAVYWMSLEYIPRLFSQKSGV